jgi:ADP-ribose pyrophosphatase YjhB (NUDIX family)
VARIDYYDDADAPEPNSLVPAASAIVTDPGNRILLQRRTDNDLWALPGGGMEFGESLSTTVVREVEEETGLHVVPLYVVAVYSDPKHVFAYDDGEVRQEFSVCVACRPVGGTLRVSDESKEVAYWPTSEIPSLPMHPRIRARIDDFLAGVRAGLNPSG